MSEINHSQFPRGALIAAAALVGFSLVSASVASLTGYSVGQSPVAQEVVSRDLQFRDNPAGGVWVLETAPDGAATDAELKPLTLVEPGDGGFIRGVMRSLTRERRMNHVGAEPGFRLTRWDDGRLTLTDLGTGRAIELNAFGSTNTATFARLLTLQGGDT